MILGYPDRRRNYEERVYRPKLVMGGGGEGGVDVQLHEGLGKKSKSGSPRGALRTDRKKSGSSSWAVVLPALEKS